MPQRRGRWIPVCIPEYKLWRWITGGGTFGYETETGSEYGDTESNACNKISRMSVELGPNRLIDW